MANFEIFLSTIPPKQPPKPGDVYLVLDPTTKQTAETVVPTNHRQRRAVRRRGGITLAELRQRQPNTR